MVNATITPPEIQQQTIDTEHYEEWLKSAVSPDIINLNVRTIHDSREIDKILNRNNKRRWKHSDELVPAWCVSGLDPLTDEPTLQGVQIKPDKPPINTDGKIQKYLGAKDFEASPLFLDTGVPYFWKSIIDDVLNPVIILEGAKKAGSVLSLSKPIAAISIPGVSTCRRKGRLHQNLGLFAKPGRTFYLGFDNDLLTKEPVQKALIGLGRELSACGSKVMVIVLPPGDAKGVDDFIAAHGEKAFKELLVNALTFEEWLDEIKNQEVETEEYKPKSKLAKYDNIIKTRWGEYLRYNTLKKRVELHGRELKADKVRLLAARQFDIDISTNDALSIVRDLAEIEAYSPVVEYLDECAAKFPSVDTSFLDGLAFKYFGTNNLTHATYFKKFLVSAVARARKPGEKVDSVFMLVSSKQGKYKSTFFRVLFGDDFFSDQLGRDVTDKDEKMKMHRYWCLEWSEFEAVYRKSDVSTLKNFITSVADVFRAPYDREPEEYLRPCVFVGTSNEQEILHDPTGDRRFWVVPVMVDKIPIFEVMRDKDLIWAAANALYMSGFEWKLTDDEELLREELNKEYQFSDYWEEIIENLFVRLQPTNWISSESIYKELGYESARQLDKASQARLTQCLTRLGFQKKTKWIAGRQQRGWEKVEKVSGSFEQNTLLDVTGVTSLSDKDSGCYTTVTPPVPPVTDLENSFQPPISTVTPVTPPVTEVYHPEALQNKECYTVTPVTSKNPNSICDQQQGEGQGETEAIEPNTQHPAPKDRGQGGSDASESIEIDKGITENGFYLGQLVKITHHSKRIDWIGKTGRITTFGNKGVRLTGGMSVSYDCIEAEPNDQGQGGTNEAGEWEQLTDDNFEEGRTVRVHAKSHPYYGLQTQLVKLALVDQEVTTTDLDKLPIAILEIQKPRTYPDFTPPAPEFTEEEVIGNVELIRESISAQSWEMITELTQSWPDEFKKAVWQRLTSEEKKLIRKMSEVAVPSDDKAKKAKQKSEATTTHDNALPLIETGGIYWSSSQNSKVRVRGEVWAGNTVRCIRYPDGKFEFEQKCQDLRCCEESPRSDLKQGDKVFIKVKGKYYNEIATVRSIGAIGAYVTVEPIGQQPKKLDKPYFAHQLLKDG